MVQIRKKSFFGQIIGVLMIIVMIWIQDKFKLPIGKTFVIVIILFFVIVLLGYFLINNLSHNQSDYERMENLTQQLRKLSEPIQKKNLILKTTKNIKLRLYDVRTIILEGKIDDDEFWINFFVDNVKEIPRTRTNLVDFDRFLTTLKTNESRSKLKSILISKGILIDEKLWW